MANPNPEEQVALVEQVMHDLGAEEGEGMASHADIALGYMKRHPAFLRRRRIANEFREFFLMRPAGEPDRVRFRYNHQTSLALMDLEADKRAGHVFVDPETEEPLEDPERPLNFRNRRYYLVTPQEAPQETVQGLDRQAQSSTK